MEKPVIRPVSDLQMQVIRVFISKSREVKSDLVKKLLIWLLDQTENLTRAVTVFIPLNQYGITEFSRKVHYGVHDMNSSSSSAACIYLILRAMETHFVISGHNFADESQGRGDHIWISWRQYDKQAELLRLPPLEEISTRALPDWSSLHAFSHSA